MKMNMEIDLTVVDVEISREEEMTNNIADIIREIFESAGEVVMKIDDITPHSFFVITEGEDSFRITWAPKFVIVHIPSEKPVLIEAFTEAIGFQPFCRYLKHGLLAFEWDWADSKERFAELEIEEKKDFLQNLQKI